MISFRKVIFGAALLSATLFGVTGCSLLNQDSPLNDDGSVDYAEFSYSGGECFEFVYPVEVAVDGNTLAANSAAELDQVFEEIPEDAEFTFVFPLQITREGVAEAETVADEAQLEQVFYECFPEECDYDWDEDGSEENTDNS